PEVAAALHTSKDGGHPSELMPVREGFGEERHLVADRTAVSRATDADPVTGLDLVPATQCRFIVSQPMTLSFGSLGSRSRSAWSKAPGASPPSQSMLLS